MPLLCLQNAPRIPCFSLGICHLGCLSCPLTLSPGFWLQGGAPQTFPAEDPLGATGRPQPRLLKTFGEEKLKTSRAPWPGAATSVLSPPLLCSSHWRPQIPRPVPRCLSSTPLAWLPPPPGPPFTSSLLPPGPSTWTTLTPRILPNLPWLFPPAVLNTSWLMMLLPFFIDAYCCVPPPDCWLSLAASPAPGIGGAYSIWGMNAQR